LVRLTLHVLTEERTKLLPKHMRSSFIESARKRFSH